MLMKCGPKPVTSFSVNTGNYQIAHTNCTKYLGVILDDKLSWRQHITNLEDALARSLGIVYMTRHYLTSSLKPVYFSLQPPSIRNWCMGISAKNYSKSFKCPT